MKNSIKIRLDRIETLLERQGLRDKTFLTLEEASIYTGYSKSTLYKYHSEGLILGQKPGGKLLRFRRKVLDHFLEYGNCDNVEPLNPRNHGK